MCSLIHVAHVVLCVLVLVGVDGVTVVHIGHSCCCPEIRSHFCRDFLYLEMYSLQKKSEDRMTVEKRKENETSGKRETSGRQKAGRKREEELRRCSGVHRRSTCVIDVRPVWDAGQKV